MPRRASAVQFNFTLEPATATEFRLAVGRLGLSQADLLRLAVLQIIKASEVKLEAPDLELPALPVQREA